MAAGLDHGGTPSTLSSPERLAPASSYPCLVTATTTSSNNSTSTTTTTLLSSSPNLAAIPTTTNDITPPSLVHPIPTSSSSPLNGSNCNGAVDETPYPLTSAGTPPSPILGGGQRRSRSRSTSPRRCNTDGSIQPAAGSNDSSSREASLEKVVALAPTEVSLDQISVEESGSAGSMRSFEHVPRNTTSGADSINGSKVKYIVEK